jgi:hypothetical protein
VTALADACADILEYLPRAKVLIAYPDTDGASGGGGKPGSRPPWNPSAAACVFDAEEGLRRLEASLRKDITGRTGPRRGGSDANTQAAITAIGNLGEAVTTADSALAARIIEAWVTRIRQLPAVDECERWIRLRADLAGTRPVCPFCLTPNLRVAVRSGLIACVLPGCADGSGNRPVATMMLGAASGQPMVVWGDGTVQAAP